MSASKKALAAKAEKLRKQRAVHEAEITHIDIQLAKIEATLSHQPVPVSGLEMLWKTALPIARTRSSQQQCRVEWNKIPKADRPTITELINALKVWNRCSEWKKDGHAFVPGLHKFIARRCWQDLPEVEAAPSRYRSIAKPLPTSTPEESATAEDIAEIFEALKPKRMNS
jgi:hypothetical protein